MQQIFRLVLVLLFFPAICSADRSRDRIDQDCGNIVPAPDVTYNGQTLRDAPDISNPQLRQINALVSENCFSAAAKALETFESENPTEFRSTFVRARMLWIFDRENDAKALLRSTIEQHPDFASGYLLLGSMALPEYDHVTAGKMFSVVERLSPSSLWLFVGKLILQDRTNPNPETQNQLIQLVQNPLFPGNARESAADEIKLHGEANFDARIVDRIYQTEIGFESRSPHALKVITYATWLIEHQGRTEDARKVLRGLKTDDQSYSQGKKLLLAESYLFDAARIDPKQTSRNFALVEKARSELDGDLGPIVRASALDPYLAPLKGFFEVVEIVDTPNEIGETGLCMSLQALVMDVELIQGMLENLADPNQSCGETTPVGLVVTRGDDPEKRKVILQDLLRRGADPNPSVYSNYEDLKTFCKNTPSKCEKVLPLLEAAWGAASGAK